MIPPLVCTGKTNWSFTRFSRTRLKRLIMSQKVRHGNSKEYTWEFKQDAVPARSLHSNR
jgi:hypothetical protein